MLESDDYYEGGGTRKSDSVLTLRKSRVFLARHTLPLKSGCVCWSASSLALSWQRQGDTVANTAVMPMDDAWHLGGRRKKIERKRDSWVSHYWFDF